VQVGLVLEPLDPRLEFPLLFTMLSWSFLDHGCKGFNEMCVRQ
jgi:hypothetical protein